MDPGNRLNYEINVAMKDIPLTAERYGALCELRRRMENLIAPAMLVRLLKEPGPAVCLVAASVGVSTPKMRCI